MTLGIANIYRTTANRPPKKIYIGRSNFADVLEGLTHSFKEGMTGVTQGNSTDGVRFLTYSAFSPEPELGDKPPCTGRCENRDLYPEFTQNK